MTSHTGILDFPKGSEPRLRQMGDGLIESREDPFVPAGLLNELSLRPSQELEVEVVAKKPRRLLGGPPL